MDISPGTERSIQRIAELLPHIEKEMKDMTAVFKRVSTHAGKDARGEDTPLFIALTDEEWVEVANAAQLKAERLRKDELPNEDMTQKQLDEWAEILESAYKKITTVLKKNCVAY